VTTHHDTALHHTVNISFLDTQTLHTLHLAD